MYIIINITQKRLIRICIKSAHTFQNLCTYFMITQLLYIKLDFNSLVFQLNCTRHLVICVMTFMNILSYTMENRRLNYCEYYKLLNNIQQLKRFTKQHKGDTENMKKEYQKINTRTVGLDILQDCFLFLLSHSQCL